MPYPKRIQKAVDELIMKQYANKDGVVCSQDYFLPEQQEYVLIENEGTGYSELTVFVPSINLCIENYDNKPKCSFVSENPKFGMNTCADHVILTLEQNERWKAHIIEMKTTMGEETFKGVKRKIRASYFSLKALCVYLGIELSDTDIEIYVTYEKETPDITPNHTSNPATLKSPIGHRYRNLMQSEWNQNKLILRNPEQHEFILHKIEMKRIDSEKSPSGSVLVNSIQI